MFLFSLGKVDASVSVTIHRQPKVQKRIGNQTKNAKLHIPFELKTGKMFSKLGKPFTKSSPSLSVNYLAT